AWRGPARAHPHGRGAESTSSPPKSRLQSAADDAIDSPGYALRSRCRGPISGGAHRVTAKLVAQHRQQTVGERVLATTAKPLEQRQRDDRDRYGALYRRLDRPATLTRIFDIALDALQAWIFGQSVRDQVQQPGAHHAAGPPRLGDGMQILQRKRNRRLTNDDTLIYGLHRD